MYAGSGIYVTARVVVWDLEIRVKCKSVSKHYNNILGYFKYIFVKCTWKVMLVSFYFLLIKYKYINFQLSCVISNGAAILLEFDDMNLFIIEKYWVGKLSILVDE